MRRRERLLVIVLSVAFAIVVAIAHARYYIAYSFVASLVVWINLRPPRRQFAYVIAMAALLWGVRLLYHEPAGPMPDPPLEQTFYLTAALLGAASLIVMSVFGAPRATSNRFEVAGAYVIAALGLSADQWFRYMTGHPLPSLDRVLYAVDAALGTQPSFVAGRWFEALPALAFVSNLVYRWLPVWLVWMFVRLPEDRTRTRLTFAAATSIAGSLGYLCYRLCPAAGPIYAFPTLYPSMPPIVEAGWVRTIDLNTSLLNAFPSLHTAWALMLLAWCSELRTTVDRVIIATVAVLTVLATLGLGEHYVVDLVGAVPFTVALIALCTIDRDTWRGRLATTAVAVVVFVAWIVGLRTAAVLALPPAAIRLALVATVLLPGVEPLVRLVRQRGHDRDAALGVSVAADLGHDAERGRA